MQSATLSARPCHVPLSKTPKLHSPRFPSASVGSQIRPHSLSLGATRPVHLPPLSIKNGRLGSSAVVRAASESGAEEVKAKEEEGGFLRTLQLGSLFGLWYLFNIYFNLYNKQVRGMPVSFLLIQFLISSMRWSCRFQLEQWYFDGNRGRFSTLVTGIIWYQLRIGKWDIPELSTLLFFILGY